MSHIPKHPGGTGRIFHLTTDHHSIDGKTIPFPGGIVLTPEPVADETVVAAWTYALRFSAKGLDLPDYEAALELLIERHPSWEIVDMRVHIAHSDLRWNAEDIPER